MRRVLSILPAVLLTAVVATPVVMADPGGGDGGALAARSPAMDLSSRAAINGYLTSIGIDRAGVVFQHGLRNYAGPNCPGKGWTCTEGTGAVVQMSSGGGGGGGAHNVFVCRPAGAGTDAATNTCVIVQSSTTGTNQAKCIEHDEAEEGTLSQSCSITQSSTSGRNVATVIQSIRMEAEGTSQDANQDSQVTQTSTTGSNQSSLVQHIHESAEDEEGPNPAISQTQEGHQDAGVAQTSTTGNNTSILSQSILQIAEAEDSASITQDQNAQNAGPNSDAEVTQNSNMVAGGKNLSRLHQANIHHADAEDATTATQRQGSPTGGLEGTVNQFSSRPAQSFNRQFERQNLDAKNVEFLSQIQFDPKRCCSEQKTNPNNVFDIDQVAVQEAGDDASQVAVAEGTCDTSGNCTVDQTHTQNGMTDTNSCSGQVCEEFLVSCNVGPEEPCPEPSPTFTDF